MRLSATYTSEMDTLRVDYVVNKRSREFPRLYKHMDRDKKALYHELSTCIHTAATTGIKLGKC